MAIVDRPAARDLKSMGCAHLAHLALGSRGFAKSGVAIEDFASQSRWVREPKEGNES
ncbi:MAG: hypothetical protein JJ934_11995 [Pseudomonadales bacterium]|nr:hypothetical protein [Pseudomonadales bacterium]MBO6657613.1 hypothetical protein [Pseudomonadales bacterium]